MTDNECKARQHDQAGQNVPYCGLNAHDCAIKDYTSSGIKSLQCPLGYANIKDGIIPLLSSGKPFTARDISKILLLPLPECDRTLSLMVKLGEIEADTKTVTYYHRRANHGIT